MSSYLNVWLVNFSAQAPAFWAVQYFQCIYKATMFNLLGRTSYIYLVYFKFFPCQNQWLIPILNHFQQQTTDVDEIKALQNEIKVLTQNPCAVWNPKIASGLTQPS